MFGIQITSFEMLLSKQEEAKLLECIRVYASVNCDLGDIVFCYRQVKYKIIVVHTKRVLLLLYCCALMGQKVYTQVGIVFVLLCVLRVHSIISTNYRLAAT